jgi:hypothetical protein
VLPIVIAEQAIENGWITIDENAFDPGKDQCLVGVGSICCRRHASRQPCDRLLDKGCLM